MESSLNVGANCVRDACGVSGIIVARQDVGYAEPFSAHQLLYPGGEDTRALLLGLLSMLPPEGVRHLSLDALLTICVFRLEGR